MKISNESKVGIFTALTITLLILGYNYMRGRDLFTSSHTYYAVFHEVDGLVASNAVMINGIRVGHVRSVDLLLDDSLKVLVRIEVNGDIQVPVNSTFRVVTNPLGSTIVKLILGNSTELAKNRDTIHAVMEPGLVDNLNKITAPLREKVTSILNGLDSTFNEDNQKALAEAMAKLPITIQTLNATLTSVKNTVDSKVNHLLETAIKIEEMILANEEQIKNTMSNLSSFSDTLAALDLKYTMDRANRVLTALDTTLTNVNNGTGTLGQLAQNRELYDEMDRVAKDLDALLKDLKENPGRYVRFSVFGKKDKPSK